MKHAPISLEAKEWRVESVLYKQAIRSFVTDTPIDSAKIKVDFTTDVIVYQTERRRFCKCIDCPNVACESSLFLAHNVQHKIAERDKGIRPPFLRRDIELLFLPPISDLVFPASGRHIPFEDDEDFGLLLRGTQTGSEGDLSSTFFALCHLFDAAARRQMPFADALGCRLPNEVTAEILSYVTDMDTRSNCMEVPSMFRDVCQEKYLFADKLMLEPHKAGKSSADPDEAWKQWNLADVAAGKRSSVKFTWDFYEWKVKHSWMVTIGSGRNRKSLLSGVLCQMVPDTP